VKAIGFSDRFDFGPIIGWELYQVRIDKYHVMLWFENEDCLLNVADRFSFMSAESDPKMMDRTRGWSLSIGDCEIEDLTEEEIRKRHRSLGER